MQDDVKTAAREAAGPALSRPMGMLVSVAGAAVLISGLIGPARRAASAHPMLGRIASPLNGPPVSAATKMAGAVGFALLVVAELSRRQRVKRAATAIEGVRAAHPPRHPLTLPPTQTADAMH